mgnify:CR=1 FL=1
MLTGIEAMWARREVLREVRRMERSHSDSGLCNRVELAVMRCCGVYDRSLIEQQILTMLFTLAGRFPLPGQYLQPSPMTPSGVRMRRRIVLAACRIAEADYKRCAKRKKSG